jgi:N-carbamoyl-L-amino-acid hydrolase
MASAKSKPGRPRVRRAGRAAPTSMIFVPCVGGVSHNESGAIKPEQAVAGANLLLRAAPEKAEAAA